MRWSSFIITAAIFFFPVLAPCHDDLVLRLIKIANGNGRSICSTAQTALSPDGKISFDPKTDTLAVVDRPDYLPHIEELVSSLDIKVAKVEMSVRIVEVTREFLKEAGFYTSQVIFSRGSFDKVSRLLTNRSLSFTKTETTLKIPSGEAARLSVKSQALFPGSVGTYVSGGLLEVLPTVNNDSTVTLKLRPSESGKPHEGSGPEDKVLTQVTLHSEDTLAIGGFDIEKDSNQRMIMLLLTAKIIY
jgi:type II secretory pathway component GspD/PulD (secretin)